MIFRSNRRRRRRSFDPLALSPLDRLIVLAAVGLASNLAVLGIRAFELGGLGLPAPIVGTVGGALVAILAALLLTAPQLRRKERYWPGFGMAAGLATSAVGALAATSSGFGGLAAGVLLVATPIALFGFVQRVPALVSVSAWFLLWLVALTGRALGLAPPIPEAGLVDLVPAVPIGAAGLVVAGRALIHFREREGQLRRLAALDELTSTANRRFFFEQCQREVARAVRYGRPLSVIMVELEGIRTINERFGHATGDRLLKEVALVLRAALRTHDLVGRYGGTVFALLLPETDREGADVVVGRCLARVRAIEVAEDRTKETRLGASIGAATFPTSGVSNVDQLLAAADLARDRAATAPRV
jgi:diguanylate cyclase (GGDEF)-like protein